MTAVGSCKTLTEHFGDWHDDSVAFKVARFQDNPFRSVPCSSFSPSRLLPFPFAPDYISQSYGGDICSSPSRSYLLKLLPYETIWSHLDAQNIVRPGSQSSQWP